MKRLPNIITVFRFLGAIGLLFFGADTTAFWAIYFACGISDMLDGCLARKLHCESKTGALLDSLVDLAFVACCCYKLIPLLVFPKWLWIWAGAIVAIKITIVPWIIMAVVATYAAVQEGRLKHY